jgi:hypothetical protein
VADKSSFGELIEPFFEKKVTGRSHFLLTATTLRALCEVLSIFGDQGQGEQLGNRTGFLISKSSGTHSSVKPLGAHA